MNTYCIPNNNRADLLAAIERRRPSRLPYTYDDPAPETDKRLREYLGLAPEVTTAAYFGCNFFQHPWDLVGWNCPHLHERQKRLAAAAPPDVTVDIWGVQKRSVVVFHPLAAAETVADIERFDWPRLEEVVFPELPPGFDAQAAKAHTVTMLWGYSNLFGIVCSMRGMEAFMMDLYVNPGMVEAMVTRIADFHYACQEQIFARYPGMVDLVRCSDDWGTQNALMINPELAKSIFMPHYRRLLDLAARHGVLGYQHSCGAIRELIPSLIEAGVRVLNPIHVAAAGMDPAALKRDFGKHLCFHGGMETQGVLLHGSPAEVRQEVRRLADVLGPDGYIATSSHNLQPDVPPPNIVAMYEELQNLPTA